MDDTQLFDLMKSELFTAVVGDVLDALGYQHQFLPPGIMPLEKHMRVVSRAMTVLEADVFSASHGSVGPLAQRPFGLLFEALDDLKESEIYVATGSSLRYALWGGLMSTRAIHLKAAGAVLDGYVRDANEIEALGFAVFCRGTYAQDQGPRWQGHRLSDADRDRRHPDRDRRPPVRRPGRRARHSACGRAGGGRSGARKGAHRRTRSRWPSATA